jgi:hypothetical protein
MGCVPALRAAMNLLHLPSQAALIRAGPLPDGLLILLRIAAGDAEVTTQASTSIGRSREMVREAAAFFLEQVLLHADADSYRVLGATRGAPYPELRRNMTLLLQWLHPDIDRRDLRSVFAARVTRAWSDLKTPERRAAYDRAQRLAWAEKSAARTSTRASSKKALVRRYVRSGAQYPRYEGLGQPSNPYPGLLRRILVLLFGRSAYRR